MIFPTNFTSPERPRWDKRQLIKTQARIFQKKKKKTKKNFYNETTCVNKFANLGGNVLTGIDGVGVRVDRLGLLLLRQVLLVLVRGFCPSLGRRAGARLQLDRAPAIGAGALGRRRALQPASPPLVDGRRDARHRVQLGVLVDRL